MAESMLISEQLRDKVWKLFTDSINKIGGAPSDVWYDHFSRDVREKLNEIIGCKETDDCYMDDPVEETLTAK